MSVSFAIAIPSLDSGRTENWKTPPACELKTVAIPVVVPDPSLDPYST